MPHHRAAAHRAHQGGRDPLVGMPRGSMAHMFRRARARDAVALRDLERAANLVALAHVFPPQDHPYPDRVVLDRWREVLADPAVTTVVGEDDEGLTAFAAFDASTLLHLAVRPDQWGTGLAAAVLEVVPSRRLWCLAENHRARRFYERLGWRPTGTEKAETFPPFPVLLEYERP
jgi:GNAT superfamily N-acetyltransferase